MPVWLVTGGSGFLGRHVLEELHSRRLAGVELFVLGRKVPPGWGRDAFLAADLADPEDAERAVAIASPDVVIHLAGQTPPATPAALYRSNTLATLHLLDALRRQGRPVTLVLAGSAAELGPLEPEDLPVGEDHPCRPTGSYGLSKLLATTAGLAARPPLRIIVARIFNPIGPGLPTSQAFGRFAARLAEPGPDPLRLTVGDLDSRRDFIDVRDVARALVVLAESGAPGQVYHVGTGRSHRVGEGLDHLIRLSGREIVVDVSPHLGGARGPGDVRAEITRIMTTTVWRPEIGWEESLADLWDHAWRSRSTVALAVPEGVSQSR
jgi:GDP-4-dehydro-6-deoxy-D-mannose reductase